MSGVTNKDIYNEVKMVMEETVVLFNSIDFLFFFPIVVIGYYAIPIKWRYIWLLISSYYFYMSWNPQYALLILFSTVSTYAGSRLLGNEWINREYEGKNSQMKKRCILFMVLFFNLGLLFFFKYSNFLITCLTLLFGRTGIALNIPKVDILLPVGISFYTFQALGYSIDVYRRDIEPEKNFLKYALFVSFFPQLAAGPIGRSKNLLVQIQSMGLIKFNISKIYRGLLNMLWGLFLKMVIADRIMILVDTIFESYYLYGGVELVAGAIAFAIQIYCDFSSYSIIAIGAAEVMGFSLMENFKAPYLSCSIKEFWRRWHISLSTWFRDYLYIPLGGSRCSRTRRYLNLMLTFLASGLWHGAAMTYVIWGGIHGIYQIVSEALAPLKKKLIDKCKIKTDCFSYKLGQIIGTFLLVDFAWIFFRSASIKAALSYIKRIFVDFNPWALSNGALFSLGLNRVEMNILFVALILLLLADMLKHKRNVTIVDFVLSQNVFFQYISIVGILLSVLIFGAYGPAFDSQAFLYFQF